MKKHKFLIGILVVLTIVVIFIAVLKYKEKNKDYESEAIIPSNYELYNYKDNEYKIIKVDDTDLVNYYYKFINNMLLNDIEEAWSYLSSSSKEKYENDIEKFKHVVTNMTTVDSKNNQVKLYNITNTENNGERRIEIIDTQNYSFTLTEKAVWKFTFSIEGQVSVK